MSRLSNEDLRQITTERDVQEELILAYKEHDALLAATAARAYTNLKDALYHFNRIVRGRRDQGKQIMTTDNVIDPVPVPAHVAPPVPVPATPDPVAPPTVSTPFAVVTPGSGTPVAPHAPTRTDSVILPSQATTELRTAWGIAVRLTEFQVAPGFQIEKITIGHDEFPDYRTAFGRRVEKGVEVAVKVLNPQLHSAPCAGLWFTEPVTQRDEAKDAEAMRPPAPVPPPAHQQVVNAAAPQGPVNGVYTIHEGQPMPNLQPGQQVVVQTSGPSSPVTPVAQGPAAPVVSAPQPAFLGVQQIGGPGQQIIQLGGGSAQTGALPAHDPNKIGILLTRERCAKIAFVLRGGIIQPQEIPAVAFAIEQAITLAAADPNKQLVPGNNEVLVYLTRAQADRVLAMVKGTDWQEIQSLTLIFDGLARGA